MSDCSDMTSQLARELTMGLRDEVEDVGEMFKKMAVIKTEPESEVRQRVVADKLKRALELARKANGERNVVVVKAIPQYDAVQISMFELAS
ncbi:MAG: hypothetical protein HFI90_02380 [Clostridia bacterium]|nr:hypothetical protein [Clostridia bacterium]